MCPVQGLWGDFRAYYYQLYCYDVHYLGDLQDSMITNRYESICALDFGFQAEYGWAMMWVNNP